MPLDSDVALLGTGVASLVAANHFVAQGKSVLLLNPDFDFFLENSELALDPLFVAGREHLTKNTPEHMLAELRPDFPGAIEFWDEKSKSSGYHDPEAPHVRQRAALFLSGAEKNWFTDWEKLEELYVEASDSGFSAQILEGVQAAKKFPSASGVSSQLKGLLIPKLCEVDVSRYRNGLLEFVRERVGPERVLCAASQIEMMPGGVRFHARGSTHTAKLREGFLVFWTPRLTQWILAQARKSEVAPQQPQGARLWEQWSILSREPLDPSVIGILKNMTVWAECEGVPSDFHRMTVLRAGPRVDLQSAHSQALNAWASEESFAALSFLCHQFLKWEKFSIRSLSPRILFDWGDAQSWMLSHDNPMVRIISQCDGPLIDVVRAARKACSWIETQEGKAK